MPPTNFRDVGAELMRLSGREQFPAGRLLRSGRLTRVASAAEIGSPRTIVNLRWQPDPKSVLFGAAARHIPFPDRLDRYETGTRRVREWLGELLSAFADEGTEFPVLLHCTSGKDRTGVAVAAILTVLDVPPPIIAREYLLSDGSVDSRRLDDALRPIRESPGTYFRKVDLAAVRARLLAVPST